MQGYLERGGELSALLWQHLAMDTFTSAYDQTEPFYTQVVAFSLKEIFTHFM